MRQTRLIDEYLPRHRPHYVVMRRVAGTPHRRTPLWQRLVALLSIVLLTVAGGLAIAILLGAGVVSLAVFLRDALGG